jgi:hypothetical protein
MTLGALSILGIIWNIYNDKDVLVIICLIVAEFCLIIISFIAITIYSNKEIPAIEAYRGNTTLQITYQDSIPIDTTVVYKNK